MSKPDGSPKKQLNVDRLASLGWHSKIGLDEGLEKTISLYNASF